MASSALEKINTELNRLFAIFNQKYYYGEIQKPIIVAQTNGKDSRTMGWCTTSKVWKDHETGQYLYEITICSEYLYRNFEEICATLLHEMAHLYNQQKGIQDCSRGNTYHNKRFKETAEKAGLIIEYDKRIGWSITKLNDEARAFVEATVDKSVFILTRRKHRDTSVPDGSGDGGDTGEETEKKPKQSFRKYICPSCGTIIRATKEVKVKCADCDVLFELEK